MTEEAKAARREYKRAWYAKNKERVKQYAEKHWTKVAAEKKGEPVK